MATKINWQNYVTVSIDSDTGIRVDKCVVPHDFDNLGVGDRRATPG